MNSYPRIFWIFVILFGGLSQGCATPMTRKAVPERYADTAVVLDVPRLRLFSGEPGVDVKKGEADWYRQQRDSGIIAPGAGESKDANFLAISGGGQNGAFTAGLLAGWSDAGTRPDFLVVTGISTGALIAPFAFLGRQYDATLKKMYTEIWTSDIARRRSFLGTIGAPSFMDSSPLKDQIAKYVDAALLREIAVQYKRGRRLYIGTTQLDTGRGIVWNMGALASSGSPDALSLFRQIMLASASIPIAFPPVLIPVRAKDGKSYDEMHVDGGASAQVFAYPARLNLKAMESKQHVRRNFHLYVIRNGRLTSHWEDIEPKLQPIAGRTVDLMVKNQGIGDLFRIYLTTRRDGVDFNLADIPDDFSVRPKEMFDQVYMTRLYHYAYERAKAGYSWTKNVSELVI